MKSWEAKRAEAIRAASGNFERSLSLMRRSDPQLADDGFALVQDMAGEHIEELLEEYSRETERDQQLTLLMIISGSGSPRAFDLLAAELLSTDEAHSLWARRGLRLMDTKEARLLLWQHGSNMSGFEEGPDQVR